MGRGGVGVPATRLAARDGGGVSFGAVVAVGVMIEGQEDLTWDRWLGLARRVEELGFESLWRSDHFHSLTGDYEREALETWASLAVLARETSRIRFGPLVCSVTFRHPSLLARTAAAVDRLSNGRLVCGIGAGWNEGEHTAFGLPFPRTPVRQQMLEEQAQILRLLWTGEPVSFGGRHYTISGARCLPTPAQRPLPILIGGAGKRTLGLVARYADEWNATSVTFDQHRAKIDDLRAACKDAGRDSGDIALSWMTGFITGRDRGEIEEHARGLQKALTPLAAMEVGQILDVLAANGWLVGTPEQIADGIRARADAGVGCVMLQHHDTGNDAVLELMAREVVPAVA